MSDPETEFFVEMGRAITCWVEVESALEEVFTATLHPAPKDAAVAVFRTNTNLHSKRRVVAAAIGGLGDSKLKKDWERLDRKISRNAQKRHMMAHPNDLYVLIDFDAIGQKPTNPDPNAPSMWFELRRHDGERPYQAKDLHQFSKNFLELATKIREFAGIAASHTPSE